MSKIRIGRQLAPQIDARVLLVRPRDNAIITLLHRKFYAFWERQRHPKRFANTGLPVIPDSVPGFAGPLAGILAGLDWLAAQSKGIEWMVSVPDDCPFLPDDLVERLHRARREIGAGGGWPARAPAKGAIR